MSLFNVGRLAVKIAGRDAGRKCVIVEKVDDKFVVVDGNVRRKKVNIKHLEPLAEVVEIKEKASHEDVKKAFGELRWPTWDKQSKKPAERPRKVRKVKEKTPIDNKAKKVPKKEVKQEAEKKEEVKEGSKAETPKEEPKKEADKTEETKE